MRVVAHGGDSTIAAQIAWHKGQLVTLREQQRLAVTPLLKLAFPPGTEYSVLDVWLDDELRVACLDAGLHSPQSLGKHLRQWCGRGIARVGANEYGAVWVCTD
jgi:hypothetical protein